MTSGEGIVGYQVRFNKENDNECYLCSSFGRRCRSPAVVYEYQCYYAVSGLTLWIYSGNSHLWPFRRSLCTQAYRTCFPPPHVATNLFIPIVTIHGVCLHFVVRCTTCILLNGIIARVAVAVAVAAAAAAAAAATTTTAAAAAATTTTRLQPVWGRCCVSCVDIYPISNPHRGHQVN